MIFEEVTIGDHNVLCMVDCGTSVSICTPDLANKLGLKILPPKVHIALADGNTTKIRGSVYLTIKSMNGNETKRFVAIMDLPRLTQLLVDNDLLAQFKKVTIDYTDERPVLILGAQPIDEANAKDKLRRQALSRYPAVDEPKERGMDEGRFPGLRL